MAYHVLLFGAEALAAGSRRVELDLDEPALTVEELREHLAAAVPSIAGTVPTCRVAVNRHFVDANHKVTQGDEVALIGMVSGG